MMTISMRHSVCAVRLALAVGVVLFLAAPSFATVIDIVDSKGFENPPYSLGNLVGQQGWLTTGVSSTANVQTAVKQAGDQAVAVTRAANEDCRWAVPSFGYPSQQYVDINWDMRVSQRTGGGYGPFFGVEAYQSDAIFGLLGSLGVDATTGDVLYQAQDTGYLVETGTTVSYDVWNHYRILLDYGADQYSVYLNGTPLATTGFVDRALGLDYFTDADISALAAGGDSESQAATGTAYYDNFLVQEVPEPSTLALCLAALAALLLGVAWRRR